MHIKAELCALFILCSVSVAFADGATIVTLDGKVLVRSDDQSPWGKANLNMQVGPNAEIKTLENSVCTLAFDAERKNIITVKEKTQIKVENIMPGRVYLPEGRVFALIKNAQGPDKFEIRTPTAITGARGTGWLTEAVSGETHVACFDDVVFVRSLDKAGNVTSQIDLKREQEVNVEVRGVEPKDVRAVSEHQKNEWKGFSDVVQHIQEAGVTSPSREAVKSINPGNGPMNSDQMIQEMRKKIGNDPAKLAEFDKMMQEARDKFGNDFEKFGGQNRSELEAFMDQMRQKFGNEFPNPVGGNFPSDRAYLNEINGIPANQPGGPPMGYNPMGQYQPGGGMFYQPGVSPDQYSGFTQAQQETTQTIMDTSPPPTTTTTTPMTTCGHSCCPYPTCCSIYVPNSPQNIYCLGH